MPSILAAGVNSASAEEFDPDYLYFLRHARPDGNSVVLELPAYGASPPSVIKYEPLIASSDGECVSDPSPGRASTNRRMEDCDASVEAPPSWLDSLIDIDDDYRVFLQNSRVVDGRLVLQIGNLIVNYEPDPDAAQSGGGSSGVKETNGGNETATASSEKRNGLDLDSADPVVIVSEPTGWDWVADPTPGQNLEGEAAVGLYDSEPRIVTSRRPKGVIWPTHINQRPDSDFKRRLMEVLCKPFSRREYLNLFDMASIRTPLVKLRQVRSDEKFYPTEELGSSYFDHYPDLVEQVQHTSFGNGLALMRGFFFWLQNSAHEDQFRPWVDDSKDHEVIPLID